MSDVHRTQWHRADVFDHDDDSAAERREWRNHRRINRWTAALFPVQRTGATVEDARLAAAAAYEAQRPKTMAEAASRIGIPAADLRALGDAVRAGSIDVKVTT